MNFFIKSTFLLDGLMQSKSITNGQLQRDENGVDDLPSEQEEIDLTKQINVSDSEMEDEEEFSIVKETKEAMNSEEDEEEDDDDEDEDDDDDDDDDDDEDEEEDEDSEENNLLESQNGMQSKTDKTREVIEVNSSSSDECEVEVATVSSVI